MELDFIPFLTVVDLQWFESAGPDASQALITRYANSGHFDSIQLKFESMLLDFFDVDTDVIRQVSWTGNNRTIGLRGSRLYCTCRDIIHQVPQWEDVSNYEIQWHFIRALANMTELQRNYTNGMLSLASTETDTGGDDNSQDDDNSEEDDEN